MDSSSTNPNPPGADDAVTGPTGLTTSITAARSAEVLVVMVMVPIIDEIRGIVLIPVAALAVQGRRREGNIVVGIGGTIYYPRYIIVSITLP
jgi:hypothetical protein